VREIRPKLERAVDQRVHLCRYHGNRHGVGRGTRPNRALAFKPIARARLPAPSATPLGGLQIQLRLRELRFGLEHVRDGRHAGAVALARGREVRVRFRDRLAGTDHEALLPLIGEVRSFRLECYVLERGVVFEIERHGGGARRCDRTAPAPEVEHQVRERDRRNQGGSSGGADLRRGLRAARSDVASMIGMADALAAP